MNFTSVRGGVDAQKAANTLGVGAAAQGAEALKRRQF